MKGIEHEIKRINDNLGGKLDNINENTRESANMLHRISERTKNNENGKTDGGTIAPPQNLPNSINLDLSDVENLNNSDDFGREDTDNVVSRADNNSVQSKWTNFDAKYDPNNISSADNLENVNKSYEINGSDLQVSIAGNQSGGVWVLHIYYSPNSDSSSSSHEENGEKILETYKSTGKDEFGDDLKWSKNNNELIVVVENADIPHINHWIEVSNDALERHFDGMSIEYSEEDLD